MNKKFGIYIHIPFCEKKCNYCNFPSSAKKNQLIGKYFSALKKEIITTAPLTENISVSTIYIGGGTPSCVSNSDLVNILSTVKNNYNIEKDAEITVECNPSSTTKEFAEIMLESGVNRFSIGIQSLNDNELKTLGRLHNSIRAITAYEILRTAGAKNISTDVIVGIPYQSKTSFKNTLRLITEELLPEHISIYSLSVEPGTPFARKKTKLDFPSEDVVADWFSFAENFLFKHKYAKYEISNFARIGFESQHNKIYWDTDSDYLGFGAASHSFCELSSKRKKLRFRNIKSIEKYIARIESNRNHRFFSMPLNLKKQIGEKIYLGLRMTSGIQLTSNEIKLFDNEIAEQIKLGLIKKTKNHKIALTKRGMQIANTVMQNFV